LRLAESRIKLQKNKKENLVAQQKKEIAHLIADGKEETARVRTEALIMEERMIEALGQLVLIAELLLVRIDAIGMNE
jgi:vacuolar protein sorting-associated protein IST1